MQFLRTLFWALLVGLAVAFAFNNWVSVDVRLWGGLVAQIDLPVLLLLTFLLGFVPVYLLYRTSRWRMRQRLAASERNVMELRNAAQLPAFPPETAPPGPVEPREDPDMLPLGAPPADAR